MTASLEGRRTSAWTNMPGFSFASGLERVAWTWTLRVASFTTESTAVIFPVNRESAAPSEPSVATRTEPPATTRAASCWGTEKFT